MFKKVHNINNPRKLIPAKKSLNGQTAKINTREMQFFSKKKKPRKLVPLRYFKNIFNRVTLENIFKILNDSVYFQNIVVCNETFRPTSFVGVIPHTLEVYRIELEWIKFVLTTALTLSIHMTKNHQIKFLGFINRTYIQFEWFVFHWILIFVVVIWWFEWRENSSILRWQGLNCLL